MNERYTHSFRPGDALVCDEGTNFIPAGTVVVFDKNTFAPFIKVLVPGIARDALGHFTQDDFRRAKPDELHAALGSVRSK